MRKPVSSWKEDRARREREAAIQACRELTSRLQQLAQLEPVAKRPFVVGLELEVLCSLEPSTRTLRLKLRRDATLEELAARISGKINRPICVAVSKELAQASEWVDPNLLRFLRQFHRTGVVFFGAKISALMSVKETMEALNMDPSSLLSWLPKPLIALIAKHVAPAKPAVLKVSSNEEREKYSNEGLVTVEVAYQADVSYAHAIKSVDADFGNQGPYRYARSESKPPDANGKGLIVYRRIFSLLQVLQNPRVVEVVVTYVDGTIVRSSPYESNQLHTFINCVCFSSKFVAPGDFVATEMGPVRVAAVIEVHTYRTEPLFALGHVFVTGGHPVWSQRTGWSRADHVLPLADCSTQDDVYCIELEDREAQMMFVSDSSVAAAPVGCFEHRVWGKNYWTITRPLLIENVVSNAKRLTKNE